MPQCYVFRHQEQVEEMKKKEERMEKQMAEITARNKMLTEPLQKAQDEVEELKKELANYDKDKETLRVWGTQGGGHFGGVGDWWVI